MKLVTTLFLAFAALPPALVANCTGLNFSSLPSAQGWLYLPDRPLPPTASIETNVFSVDGTKLVLNTVGNGNDPFAFYTRRGVVPSNAPFTLTLRARVTQTIGDAHAFWVEVDHDWLGRFYFALKTNSLLTTFDGTKQVHPIDATQFHTYRLEGFTGGLAQLFVDGVWLAEGPADEVGDNEVAFGTGSGSNRVEITQFDFCTGREGAEPAIEWGGGHAEFFSDDDGPFVIGFQFLVNSNITVTALGAYDYSESGDGLSTPHIVGIWPSSGGAPIAVGTVLSGTDSERIGEFRYVNIPGVSLSANSEYIIGASDFYGSTNDIYAYGVPVQALSVASAITFIAGREVMTTPGTLSFPVGVDASSILTFGANFRFVPGPLLAIALRSTSQLELSWATNATAYHLEYAASLPATAWNTVTNVPAIVANRFVVSLTNPVGIQGFFRLNRP
jgi:hypothetical protein